MENKAIFPKTFILALSLFSGNNRQARSFLTDKRLTRDEKKILQGFFEFRASKDEEAVKLVSSIESTSSYVLALKHLLLGCVYNNQSDFHNSLTHLKIAQKQLAALELPYFKFICVLNLFVVFHNLKNRPELDSLIAYIGTIYPRTPLEEFRILRCQFIYYSFIQDSLKARAILTQIKQIKDKSVDSDRGVFLIDEFNFCLKESLYTECFEVLTEIKNVKLFYNSGLFNYMKSLLHGLVSNKANYLDLQSLKGQPMLYWEMKVIKSLEENHSQEAHEAWQQLHNFNPQIYQTPFSYSGDKCLFSLMLEKVLKPSLKRQPIEAAESMMELESVSEKIIYFLKAEISIHKEELYLKVFGRAAGSKEDLQRLSKNIYKLNKRNGEQITYHKGSYKLAG